MRGPTESIFRLMARSATEIEMHQHTWFMGACVKGLTLKESASRLYGTQPALWNLSPKGRKTHDAR